MPCMKVAVSWKNSFVHLIPKSDRESFRPISLTSCICKLLETMIKNRLQFWTEKNNLLPSSQHGCIDNLACLTMKLEEAFLEKKEILAVFLDVQGAFDNVKVDILLNKLAVIGCPTSLIQLIKFISYVRIIYCDFLNAPRAVYKGVPQGGILSSLLYILYTSSICTNVRKQVIVSQFADDIPLYIKFSSLKRA